MNKVNIIYSIMNYIEISKNMIIILLSIIIVIYIYTDSNTKIFGKEIWPIKKEERFKKLIVYEATDEYKDRTVLDPYSITHISHGILLYYIMNFIYPNQNIFNLYRSLFIEITWEILENMNYLINLYRKYDKYSKNYIGDSIVNILADIILMIIGFLFASRYRHAYIFVIISEIVLYMKIKDNLTKSIKDIIIIPLLMK